MAYIYLEELKEHLPVILSDWIEPGDEGWEWIFQEIEQKCHVGKRLKGKKWKKKIQSMVDTHSTVLSAHRNDINKLESLLKGNIDNVTQLGLTMKDLGAEIRRLRNDITAAKSMAETAKQRTEVDYTKCSQTDNKYKIRKCDQPITAAAKCESCKYISKNSLDQPCAGCCYNGMNISGMDKWEANDGSDRKTT